MVAHQASTTPKACRLALLDLRLALGQTSCQAATHLRFRSNGGSRVDRAGREGRGCLEDPGRLEDPAYPLRLADHAFLWDRALLEGLECRADHEDRGGPSYPSTPSRPVHPVCPAHPVHHADRALPLHPSTRGRRACPSYRADRALRGLHAGRASPGSREPLEGPDKLRGVASTTDAPCERRVQSARGGPLKHEANEQGERGAEGVMDGRRIGRGDGRGASCRLQWPSPVCWT